MATPADESRDPASQEDVAAGEDDEAVVEELRALKRQRGRKASVFARAYTAIDGLLGRQHDSGELKKRLDTLNVALDGFLEANDAYVALLEDMEEMEEASQYAARITTRYAELTKRIEEAMVPPQQAASVKQDESRISESRASGRSRASTASRDAEIFAELKALELRQLRARQQRIAEQRRREIERKNQEDAMEMKAAEEELEHARLKARLLRAAESELTWERRNDFREEGVNEVETHEPAPTSTVQLTEEHTRVALLSAQQGIVCRRPTSAAHLTEENTRATYSSGQQSAACRRDVEGAAPTEVRVPSASGRNPDDWIRELRSDHPVPVLSPSLSSSAFVKSIPRLSLPTFRGDAREWPRWIGLFKALVHDQPSLTDSERMAHLQNAVDGPASQAIDGMLFNGALYQEALVTLQERFGREEDVTQAHLRSIFSATPPSLTDLPAMEKFYAIVNNTVTVLRNLGYDSDLKSSENLRRVAEKLPSELLRDWGKEVYRLRPERPSLETFSQWLKVQVGILSYSTVTPAASDRRQPDTRPREGPAAMKSVFATGTAYSEQVESRPACAVCKDAHRLTDCPAFKAKTMEARMDVVSTERLCFSCLKKGHWSRRCRTARRCGIEDCRFQHHPLLHHSKRHAETDEDAPRKQEGARSTPFVAASTTNGSNTLLQIVAIRVHGERGTKDVLALLDTGAQMSLCSEDVLREIGVTGESRPLSIQNVETSGMERQSERVKLTISALGAEAKKQPINIHEVWSVPALNVTATAVQNSQLREYQHLHGLDFPQYNGGPIKMLIGANVPEAVVQKESRAGRSNQPAAVKTALGWTLTGSIAAAVPSSLRHVLFLSQQAQPNQPAGQPAQQPPHHPANPAAVAVKDSRLPQVIRHQREQSRRCQGPETPESLSRRQSGNLRRTRFGTHRALSESPARLGQGRPLAQRGCRQSSPPNVDRVVIGLHHRWRSRAPICQDPSRRRPHRTTPSSSSDRDSCSCCWSCRERKASSRRASRRWPSRTMLTPNAASNRGSSAGAGSERRGAMPARVARASHAAPASPTAHSVSHPLLERPCY